MKCVVFVILFTGLLSCSRATGIIDLIKWGFDLGAPSFGREAESDDASLESEEENCECVTGLNCNCCMKLNFTFIDFGEPGCVNVQYAAFDQSLEFNMTFGENELHTQSVDVDSIEPACMNLVGDVPIAYVCATLSKFKLDGDKMKGCLHIEPSILGETQARYFMGCFGFSNNTSSGEKTGNGTKLVSSLTRRPSGANRKANRTSASAESAEASSSTQEEEEEEDEDTPGSNGIIEQGASILSNIFYYFSPDSGEEDKDEKDNIKPEKIVLVSSTEAALKEEASLSAGFSELPPTASEDYDSTGTGSDASNDAGEEIEDEDEEETEGGEQLAASGATGSGAASTSTGG